MLSIGHLIVILLIVMIIFGSGKITSVMQDLAKGIRVFKKEINKDDSENESK